MITNPNVKINLGLNVLRKREDGFHDLETLFIPYFGISNTLEIIVGDDYSRTSASIFGRYGGCDPMVVQAMSEDGKLMITIARAEGVDWNPLDDLTAKAYQILAEDFELPPVKIFLEKTSPVGAGLGGGSADTAFALKMLNELCGLSPFRSVLEINSHSSNNDGCLSKTYDRHPSFVLFLRWNSKQQI